MLPIGIRSKSRIEVFSRKDNLMSEISRNLVPVKNDKKVVLGRKINRKVP